MNDIDQSLSPILPMSSIPKGDDSINQQRATDTGFHDYTTLVSNMELDQGVNTSTPHR